jgi:hypothetical protein
LYALLQRGTRASTAAAFTLVATAAVDVLSPAPGPGCPLSLALVLAAAGLLARGSNRAPAVAAGTFLGAAVASDPLTCAGALALLGAGAVARLRSTPAADRPAVRTRLALATGVALVWAAPFLWQLDFTWSDSERMLLPPLVAIARRALAPALCAGFVIAAWRTPFAVGVANHVAPAAGLLALLGLLAGPLRARPAAEPAPADRSLQAWTAEHTLPLDCVAVDPGSAGVWIPALADRATDRPPLPAYYQDELAAGRRARRCRWRYPEGLAGERRAGAALPQLLEER